MLAVRLRVQLVEEVLVLAEELTVHRARLGVVQLILRPLPASLFGALLLLRRLLGEGHPELSQQLTHAVLLALVLVQLELLWLLLLLLLLLLVVVVVLLDLLASRVRQAQRCPLLIMVSRCPDMHQLQRTLQGPLPQQRALLGLM